MTITRADYMSGKVTHEQFYRSVVARAGLSLNNHPDVPKWRDMLASGDEHLNKLGLDYWDRLALFCQSSVSRSLREHGDFYSMAGGVCAVKAAARIAVEKLNEGGG
jgi:hypothetical protein